MLFRKNMPHSCQYCACGTLIEDNTVLCTQKGVVSIDDKCRKFKYDPCKRIPPKQKAMDFSQYENEDYSL